MWSQCPIHLGRYAVPSAALGKGQLPEPQGHHHSWASVLWWRNTQQVLPRCFYPGARKGISQQWSSEFLRTSAGGTGPCSCRGGGWKEPSSLWPWGNDTFSSTTHSVQSGPHPGAARQGGSHPHLPCSDVGPSCGTWLWQGWENASSYFTLGMVIAGSFQICGQDRSSCFLVKY